MPLVALVLVAAMVGLATSVAAADELRASPRPVFATETQRMVLVHAVVVVLPVAALLLWRAPDWLASYAVALGSMPSLALGVLALVIAALPVASFAVGAMFVRSHRSSWALGAAGACVAAACIALVVGRHRLGFVGTVAEFRAPAVVRDAVRSSVWPLVGACLVWLAAAAHLAVAVRRKG